MRPRERRRTQAPSRSCCAWEPLPCNVAIEKLASRHSSAVTPRAETGTVNVGCEPEDGVLRD